METYLKKICLLGLLLLFGTFIFDSKAQNPNDSCSVIRCPIISVKIVPASYRLPNDTTSPNPSPKEKVQRNFPVFDNYLNTNTSQYDNNVSAFICNDTMYYSYQRGQYSDNDILPIASATKWLTASVIMSLVDSQKLSLDDNIGKYLPIFDQYGKGNITIRQIFSHTSGLPIDTPFDDRGGISLQAAVDSIAIYTNLLFTPGIQAQYGSSSYKVAARIAEVIEGKLWQQIFEERIAGKCEMTNTSYSNFINSTNPHAGAGVRSTMNDYVKFLTMIYNFGVYKGVRVLTEASVKAMELDQSNGVNSFYGLGVWRYQIVAGSAKEVSSPSATGIHPWINREKKYFGIIFTQAGFDKTINANLNFRSLVQNILN